jgi:hypothetical protein
MHKDVFIRKLAALGYEVDWSVSGPHPGDGWAGTIDAIGRNCIDGDCRGEVVISNTRAGWM